MKAQNQYLIALVLFCICGFTACKKRLIEPVVPQGTRVVLLEEFTGKGCTNCPKGSREIESLLSLYQERLVVVSIHANFFADPQFFPLGQYDLRTDEGELLFDLLGPNFGYPAGVINRRKFNNDLQHPANVWAGFIQQESEIEPDLEFTITRDYTQASRILNLGVTGRAKSALSDPLRISVMITESGIIDAQDDAEAGGIVPDYVHNHVLRDMLTPYDGQALAPSLAAAEEFNIDFSGYQVSADWADIHCHIIVFVSRKSASGDIAVLQAGEVALME